MSEGQVLHAEHEGVHVLKLRGDIRFSLCAPAERFLQSVMQQPIPRPFLVDLLETESLDSTALGVLALIARYMQERFGQKAALLVRSPDLHIILNSVCFDRVFHLVDDDPAVPPESFKVLAELPADGKAFALLTLRAHRALMALSRDNQAQFQDVVAALEREQKHA